MNTTTRPAALFDLDKTIYRQHSFFGFAKNLADEGLMTPAAWSAITIEAQLYESQQQGYSLTAQKLLEIFGNGIRNQEYSRLRIKADEYIKRNHDQFYPYFEQVLPKLRETHAVYLVTTNSQMLAEAVRDLFGLDGCFSTIFEVQQDRCTGQVASTLAHGKEVIQKLIAKHASGSIAVGDSENDLAMLEHVATPICFEPSTGLRQIATERHWLSVDEHDAAAKILGLLETT